MSYSSPNDPAWQQPSQAVPGSYPPAPQASGHPYGYLPSQQTHTVASTGLPGWMHVLYAIGGFVTCGILWVVWAVHWWFVQSKTKTTAMTQASIYPPPPPYQHPAPPSQYGPPPAG